LRVVGVVGDTRDVSLVGAPLAMYVPFRQHRRSNLVLAVRARGSSPVPASTLRQIVSEVNPGVAVLGGQTLSEQLRSELRPQRTAGAWIGVFGAIALLLAAIGLYGVVTQGVVQRTRELAIRSALGSSPRGIVANVLGDGMRLVVVGGVVGGLGSVGGFRILRSLFAGVQTVDVGSALVAAGVLVATMIVAAYLPARRAAKLNLVDALRID
jgi:ABC-type antimicrobial peptide transport system permease subunit